MTQQQTPDRRSKHGSNFNAHLRNFSLLLCLGMLAGVLIWAKLRLVTDIPRSAYADPREAALDTSDDALMDSDQAKGKDESVGDHRTEKSEESSNDEPTDSTESHD
ncbi:MAG: hypothetical protein ACWA5W_06030 [Phycisphaerales bacterium]